jgi:hypothetical protein
MTSLSPVLSLVRPAWNALNYALCGLARAAESAGLLDSTYAGAATLEPEARTLLHHALASVAPKADLLSDLLEYLSDPAEADHPLVAVAQHFQLTMIEVLAVRVAVAAEEDLLIGHIIARLQHPLAQSRPAVGLLARAFGGDSEQEGSRSAAVQLIAQGAAASCGLLELLDPGSLLPERQVRVPLPTCLALAGVHGGWPGTSILHTSSPIPLSAPANEAARLFGRRLSEAPIPGPALVLRGGDSAESRSAAEKVALACERRAVLISSDLVASNQILGLAPWLFLNGFMPVLTQTLAPGERRPLPGIPGFSGPFVVLSGYDGEFTSADSALDRPILEWRLTIPTAEERFELWRQALGEEGDAPLSRRMACEHRHTAGRIAVLAAKAKERGAIVSEAPARQPTYEDIRSVALSGEGIGLSALAELVSDEVPDEALVVTPALRLELDSLVDRCLLRDGVHSRLGPAMQARAQAAVRALFAGPSGTGKTLAASWLATRLGLPLFRVDLSAISSKYIGETEKNLSQLLTRAEQSEVVLLFDEADSLFAKRTDVHDANDRFANAQTNYLLQRMESYDGITLLTSNSRGRFDAAFARRLDAILEFALPGPEQRRVLWLAHLGDQHCLTPTQLNLIAATAELSGGQVRNAVLSAAVTARAGGPISFAHIVTGLASEYRKLGRQLPDELRRAVPLQEQP